MNLQNFGKKPLFPVPTIGRNLASNAVASLARHAASFRGLFFGVDQKFGPAISPERASHWLKGFLFFFTVALGAYWFLKILQVPFPSSVSARGVVFYGASKQKSVGALFGEKGFDTSRLTLRGLVITGSSGGKTEGIALIEVDGKPAAAMSLGDMVPPGIRLEKITPDGVVVSYQGKEINLQQSFDKASGKIP